MTLTWRQKNITKPLFKWVKSVLPELSETERAALTAGGVWWDAELFSGNPNWDRLRAAGTPKLSAEEQAFLDGPVETLCGMIDDWRITFEDRDLPDEIWDFIRAHKFFGMIIPKKYGGLEFSAYAHSEIVMRLSTRSISVAVTVMVPNSLGPGELLLHFGTDAQKDHYLPRLADGREIPCFALTSPEAGSDAASMIDRGTVCYENFDGARTLGIRLTWHKRYITLGPVASLLGLAFKLYDPDHILSAESDRGITLALVPTDTAGVSIGRRHFAAMQAFQNGPNSGQDVFIPMDWIIGGQDRIGQGWEMLMTALAAGRGISLPALSVGGAKLAAHTAGAYARVRRQFGISIGKFEGIQEALARIAGTCYLLDSARLMTVLALDLGEKPAVISAILKSQATNYLRDVINDAMDIHAGKAVIDGPLNYIGNVYRAVPVAITVEGANILTRSLMIFGQGAIRCHPYLLEEITAAEDKNEEHGLRKFDSTIWKHAAHQLATVGRTLGRNLFYSAFRPGGNIPGGNINVYYSEINRVSASLAFISEISLLSLGGALKRKEFISARLGDVLSDVYLLSAALKRFEDGGRKEGEQPLLDWCFSTGLKRIEDNLDNTLKNYPNRVLAFIMRLFMFPLGRRQTLPDDRLTTRVAEILLKPSDIRDRLTKGLYHGHSNDGLGDDGLGDDGLARLDAAFAAVVATDHLYEKRKKGNLSDDEQAALAKTEAAVAKVIEVDDFSPHDLTGTSAEHSPSQNGDKTASTQHRSGSSQREAS